LEQIRLTEVVSHDVAPLTVNTDATPTALGWAGSCCSASAGFLVGPEFRAAGQGRADVGHGGQGKQPQGVQHQTGGTVQEILVKDGDVVKAGQVLVRMNDVSPNRPANHAPSTSSARQ
jgi:protease secretion system membrane fusion protein